MRHRNTGKKLGRNSSHRKAMFRNMSVAIINNEIIRTTLQKAKELRRFLEPLVTLAKEDSVFNRRMAFAQLRSKEAVGKLFQDLGPKHLERKGGYVQILKHGFRAGDTASMAIVKFCE